MEHWPDWLQTESHLPPFSVKNLSFHTHCLSQPSFFNNTGGSSAFLVANAGNLTMGDAANITQNAAFTLLLQDASSACETRSNGNFLSCGPQCTGAYDQPAGVLACTPVPPTAGPTMQPTVEPTPSPTSLRPRLPSAEPSASPTSQPTTQAPSAGPTSSPSHSPTLQPSLAPTLAPTVPIFSGNGKLVPVETGNWTGVAASGK